MMLWLYTEQGAPSSDGPFFSLDEVLDSTLWEAPGVCLWAETYRIGVGWIYENVKWCGDHWLTTSTGVRPLAPIRPHYILDISDN